MTDTGRTEPLPDHSGSTPIGEQRPDEHGPRSGTARADSSQRMDPVQAVQQPDNRAKLLLATAFMTLLSLLLLIWILVEVLGTSYEPVTVDGQSCVIELGNGDESVLYCQR